MDPPEPGCDEKEKLLNFLGLISASHKWSPFELSKVISKLNFIDIHTIDDLHRAFAENNINHKLTGIGAPSIKIPQWIEDIEKHLPKEIYYFAYGSNMSAERMKERKVVFTSRFLGYVKGYSLSFNKLPANNPNSKFGYGSLDADPLSDKPIYGIVYTLKSISELCKLDEFEGVETKNYFRKSIKITIPGNRKQDERKIESITYFVCVPRLAENLKPTPEYLEHLLAGADLLPSSYVDSLKLWLKN